MKKTIKTESFAKKVYTKQEIRYINEQDWVMFTQSMVPAGCHYRYIGHGKNYGSVIDVTVTNEKQLADYEKAFARRAKALRKKMDGVDVVAWCKRQDERNAAHQKRLREDKDIQKMLFNDGFEDGGYFLNPVRRYFNLGANVGAIWFGYNKYNGISVTETEGSYSNSCRFTKVVRSFKFNIRRGWHLYRIGGVLTFVKGERIDRRGIACEWLEQGKAIADIRTVKGWLVRGEHIEAKTLREAQAISASHRAKQLERIMDARHAAARKAEVEATTIVTFEDSLNAGNCRPGTMSFKQQYEAAIGHEADSITVADLRKYGRQFGVSRYAERAIQYVMNH